MAGMTQSSYCNICNQQRHYDKAGRCVGCYSVINTAASVLYDSHALSTTEVRCAVCGWVQDAGAAACGGCNASFEVFPTSMVAVEEEQRVQEERDYLDRAAMAALTGLVRIPRAYPGDPNGRILLAETAYDIADEMLAERKRRHKVNDAAK